MEQIKEIAILNLFEDRDLELSLPIRNSEDGQTVIFTGVNGSGKSTILKIMYAAMQHENFPRMSSFAEELDFEAAIFMLVDGKEMEVSKTDLELNNQRNEIQLRHPDFARNYQFGLGKNGITFDDRLRFNPRFSLGPADPRIRPWMNRKPPKVSLLIDTERLYIRNCGGSKSERKIWSDSNTASIDIYLKWFSSCCARVESKASQMRAIQQRDLVERIIESINSDSTGSEDLDNQYQENKSKLEFCQEYSLLKGEDVRNVEGTISEESESGLSLRSVFTVLYRDQAEILEIVFEFARRISLLLDVLNESLADTHKTINIEKRDRFRQLSLVIKDSHGNKIEPSKLSSGEQHIISMYITLFMNIENEANVFIDEPEISLHPRWQRGFVKNIERLRSVVHFNLYIATHSVGIIDDNWKYECSVPFDSSPVRERFEDTNSLPGYDDEDDDRLIGDDLSFE
ncbi:AAA family ATPase [Corynebacterium amycolatum]|uniref:AAA family ATPase n=1 Tax=Corynebacterium amycolatum TaxID=43765 RepID=UPI00234CA5D9|nr:AAA family ATPase [Corynebacterium amycolatum]MDC7116410.1 AAA family ATPase [Corynebacterium amycolatum]